MNNLDNMEYSLQQYAAMTQAQLFNAQTQTNAAETSQIQDPNTGFNLAYTPFPLIRMAPPQLHQPTLAKEIIPTTTTIEETHHDNNRIVSGTPIRVTRPPNAYLLFNKEMRKILKDQDPTMKVADISKEVGSRWKNMPKEQKDQYVNQANKLKEEQRALHPNSMYIRRSRAELVKAGHFVKKSQATTITTTNETIPSTTDLVVPKRKKNKREKNSTIPKHPLSAYMWYLTEVRPETMRNFPGSNVGQISKLCANRWNTMSEEARLPWKSKAQIDKDRYAREMQIYALQNDHHLGRGTRQKYRTAANALREKSEHSTPFDDVTPLFYTTTNSTTTEDKSMYHHSLVPEQHNLPMTLNPNALLHHRHNDSYSNNN